jgi:hypothetical protein
MRAASIAPHRVAARQQEGEAGMASKRRCGDQRPWCEPKPLESVSLLVQIGMQQDLLIGSGCLQVRSQSAAMMDADSDCCST